MPAAVVTPTINAVSIVKAITEKVDAVLPDRQALTLKADMARMVDRVVELNTALSTALVQAQTLLAAKGDVATGASLDAINIVRTDRDKLLTQMVEAEKILSFQDGAGNLKGTGKKVLADIQALLAAKR